MHFLPRASLVATLALLATLIGCACGQRDAQADSNPARAQAQSTVGLYRHVVLFKWKDTATAEDIQRVERAFRELPGKIDTIRGFEWGTDVSPEGRAEGFTHCYLITFDNRAGLDVYLPHPAHKHFVSICQPVRDKVIVVDYVARD